MSARSVQVPDLVMPCLSMLCPWAGVMIGSDRCPSVWTFFVTGSLAATHKTQISSIHCR